MYLLHQNFQLRAHLGYCIKFKVAIPAPGHLKRRNKIAKTDKSETTSNDPIGAPQIATQTFSNANGSLITSTLVQLQDSRKIPVRNKKISCRSGQVS